MSESLKGLMSSNRQDWGTPDSFMEWLDHHFCLQFDLDAAASDDNHKAPTYYTKEDDGLNQEWYGRVWLNPPFGRELPLWLAKCAEEIKRDEVESIHVLIPARTDTKWFHELVVQHASTVFFIKGRLNFRFDRAVKGANAPFPSMLVVFDKWPRVLQRAYMRPLEIPTWARGFSED